MTDVLTAAQRSRNMAAIKGKDTKPEMIVRRMLHGLGFRYALHKKGLPGKPDLVFSRRKKVIFVHGCYWHMHDCRWGKVVEATRTEFWQAKRTANVSRDQRHVDVLQSQGWQVLIVWECETRDVSALQARLEGFLKGRQGVRSSPVR